MSVRRKVEEYEGISKSQQRPQFLKSPVVSMFTVVYKKETLYTANSAFYFQISKPNISLRTSRLLQNNSTFVHVQIKFHLNLNRQKREKQQQLKAAMLSEAIAAKQRDVCLTFIDLSHQHLPVHQPFCTHMHTDKQALCGLMHRKYNFTLVATPVCSQLTLQASSST